jgi:hypothetical protein
VKVGDAWRFANVVKRSGRTVRDHVLIAGRDEYHPEGSHYLEWYEHGKRYRKVVADFATVAEATRLKVIEVEALKAATCFGSNRTAAPMRKEGTALDATVRILVIHAQEDWMIARECWNLVRTATTSMGH